MKGRVVVLAVATTLAIAACDGGGRGGDGGEGGGIGDGGSAGGRPNGPGCTKLFGAVMAGEWWRDTLKDVCEVDGMLILNQGLTDVDFFENLIRITGTLEIKGTGITSLEGLRNLKELGALIVSGNDDLVSLRGLENLQAIGAVAIDHNPLLTNLEGLEGVRSVDRYLYVGYNAKLASVKALSNLAKVDGSLRLDSNPELRSLDGLENLKGVGGYLSLRSMPLTSLQPLASLERVGESLGLNHLPELRNLLGLHSLRTVGQSGGAVVGAQSLYIGSTNTNLETVEFDSLTEVGGNLWISPSPSLVSIRLPNLKSIGAYEDGVSPGVLEIKESSRLISVEIPAVETIVGGVEISEHENLRHVDLGSLRRTAHLHLLRNRSLQRVLLGDGLEIEGDLKMMENRSQPSLQGMEGLRSVGGELKVYALSEIRSLSGLAGLEEVGRALHILNNYELQDVELPKLRSAMNLWISGNYKVPDCQAQALAAQIGVECKCTNTTPICP